MRDQRAYDNTAITPQWLDQWADRQEFCWTVPGSDLLIARHRDHLRTDLWSILREEEDGEETVLANVRDRGDVREALESLGVESDGVELADLQ